MQSVSIQISEEDLKLKALVSTTLNIFIDWGVTVVSPFQTNWRKSILTI